MTRDTSRDGLKNKLRTFALTRFRWLWRLIQAIAPLAKFTNKTLINGAIYALPTRPYPHSLMTLETHIPGTTHPKNQDTYTSWDSLTDRTYLGRHLPPDEKFNAPASVPDLEQLKVLFEKPKDANGESVTRDSQKSTLLFPYWVQWFTDGFLRVAHHNKLKNTSNHHIDLSPVYGLTPQTTHKLRTFKGGKLKSQIIGDEEYPLYVYEDAAAGRFKAEFQGLYQPLHDEEKLDLQRKSKLFAMGVERANVQVGYVMLNVLCLREHNQLCDKLAQRYPDWDDERLFQTARNILIAEIMKIIVEEYINHITPYHFNLFVDPSAFTHEKWFRTNWMTLEFSLVYRWHSALPEHFQYGQKQLPMAASLWNNDLLTQRGLGILFEEASTQPSTEIGLFNTADFLVELTELASIQLGRDAKLKSYNEYRKLCNFPEVTDFDQITQNPKAQELLKKIYGSVDNIEFYVGLYAEDVRENSALSPLIGRMVGADAFSQALTNPLLSNNLFNPDTFSQLGWEIIHETDSLSTLVNRNVPQSNLFKVSFDRTP